MSVISIEVERILKRLAKGEAVDFTQLDLSFEKAVQEGSVEEVVRLIEVLNDITAQAINNKTTSRKTA